MIRNKTIKFNLDKPEERELWEQLQRLPHGMFSEGTKEYWRKLIQVAEEENSPERKFMKEMSDKVFRYENPWYDELEKQTEEHLDKVWSKKEEKK